jgi:hypothetical protein
VVAQSPAVNFTKDDIGFTYALFTVYIGLINTNNQIIQAIAVDIACVVRGFAINGEDAGDHNGVSASTAGDVNGDGLDEDLPTRCLPFT